MIKFLGNVGSAVGGAFNSTGGQALMDIAGQALSGWQSLYSNSKLAAEAAKRNYEYSLRYLENAPSSQVRGLKEAGLNPILAVSGGFSSSSPSQFSGTPSASSTPFSGFSRAKEAETNRKLADSQIKAQESIVDKNKADADFARANARKADAETYFIVNEKGAQSPTGFVHKLATRLFGPEHPWQDASSSKDNKAPYLQNVPATKNDYHPQSGTKLSDGEVRVSRKDFEANQAAKHRREFVERRTKELGNQRYLKGREADMDRARVW